mmetsp:Transcript_52331/g.161811  ORF Transcript_52331/g.161811 Transcript_52331/m.161811 type:complete len:278 (-) Transcript_52331:436-1269(-)
MRLAGLAPQRGVLPREVLVEVPQRCIRALHNRAPALGRLRQSPALLLRRPAPLLRRSLLLARLAQRPARGLDALLGRRAQSWLCDEQAGCSRGVCSRRPRGHWVASCTLLGQEDAPRRRAARGARCEQAGQVRGALGGQPGGRRAAPRAQLGQVEVPHMLDLLLQPFLPKSPKHDLLLQQSQLLLEALHGALGAVAELVVVGLAHAVARLVGGELSSAGVHLQSQPRLPVLALDPGVEGRVGAGGFLLQRPHRRRGSPSHGCEDLAKLLQLLHELAV